MMNSYLKIAHYIVSLDCIHGVLNNTEAGEGFRPQVIITYTNNTSACLDFTSPEEARACFDKIGQALGVE
jgi:hypothetical protein